MKWLALPLLVVLFWLLSYRTVTDRDHWLITWLCLIVIMLIALVLGWFA